MKKLIALLFMSAGVAILTAQTLSQNYQFSDMEGNDYDLYALLDQGKHVLCHFTFNG